MEEIKLDVQLRAKVGSRNVRAVRREDAVPAIVYGGDRKPTAIKVDRRTYQKIMRNHKGQSVVFHLNVLEGEKNLRDYSVILKDEQYHPVSDSLIHIDFQRISLKEKLEANVPVVIRGESIGVKKDGGSIDQPLRELDVFCLPTSIPQHFEIDVTELHIGDAVHVKDLVMPEGVETRHDPETVVVSIVKAMREEEEVEGEESIEPEVIKKEKESATEEASEGGEKKAE